MTWNMLEDLGSVGENNMVPRAFHLLPKFPDAMGGCIYNAPIAFFEREFICCALLEYGCFTAVVPNLGPPDVLRLQLPEAFTTTSAGQDFWELKSKNIWRPKVGEQCFRGRIDRW